MYLPHALLLGLIEGLTEFLPVSSTAHLIIGAKILQIPPTPALSTFQIVIQLGAILAVAFLYLKKIVSQPKRVIPIMIAFIPTMLIGLGLYKIVKEVFLETFSVTVFGLLAGGLYLVAVERFIKPKTGSVLSLNPKQASLIGVFQSLAMIPGLSRSAMTITGGRLVGLSREEAVEFSFLLAVPVMVAASVLDLYQSRNVLTQGDFGMIAIGFITAFVTALASMKWFVNFAKSHSLSLFGWYRIALAIVLFMFIK